MPLAGLSLMLEADFRAAVVPLFSAGVVDVVEWSFDTCWDVDHREPSVAALLDHFAAAGRLLGHGVTFSPLSAGDRSRQAQWLAQLGAEVERRDYAHVTEHFGWLTTAGFDDGAPLPLPFDGSSLQVGRDAVRRLADVAQRPVGLENLALALSRDDVANQGEFLDALLEPVDGVLLLDLHNLYCQACNFDLDPRQLLASYPLDRVRELHIAGGSWSPAADGSRVRRDTHDQAVPDDVFALLEVAVDQCPRLEAVILERLGGTLATGAEQLRADYERMRAIAVRESDVHT